VVLSKMHRSHCSPRSTSMTFRLRPSDAFALDAPTRLGGLGAGPAARSKPPSGAGRRPYSRAGPSSTEGARNVTESLLSPAL
jgi:hypothetical protein